MDNLKEKVVIAVSSRALFDLEEEHALFEEKGYKAFRDHQVRYQNTPLRPGVAFPFVRRLLALNELYGDLAPFRVIALSRNSPRRPSASSIRAATTGCPFRRAALRRATRPIRIWPPSTPLSF